MRLSSSSSRECIMKFDRFSVVSFCRHHPVLSCIIFIVPLPGEYGRWSRRTTPNGHSARTAFTATVHICTFVRRGLTAPHEIRRIRQTIFAHDDRVSLWTLPRRPSNRHVCHRRRRHRRRRPLRSRVRPTAAVEAHGQDHRSADRRPTKGTYIQKYARFTTITARCVTFDGTLFSPIPSSICNRNTTDRQPDNDDRLETSSQKTVVIRYRSESERRTTFFSNFDIFSAHHSVFITHYYSRRGPNWPRTGHTDTPGRRRYFVRVARTTYVSDYVYRIFYSNTISFSRSC